MFSFWKTHAVIEFTKAFLQQDVAPRRAAKLAVDTVKHLDKEMTQEKLLPPAPDFSADDVE